MRNTQKWLVLVLCAMMLVNMLSITAAATESAAPLELDFYPAAEAGMVQVDILATESQIVADGRLVLTYDPAVLTYEGTEISDAWTNADDVTLSDNAKDGKLILAFASADAAEDGVLFRIRFSGAVCDTLIHLEGRDSYISGTSSVPAIGGLYCPSDRFTDLRNLGGDFHNAIDYMVANGYLFGMTNSTFGPNVKLDRAMMVTVLYRIAGRPAVEGTSAFADVPADDYFTDAVIWAAENGIAYGISEKLFAPYNHLNRQELVTFLYRFAGYMGYDRSATTELSGFDDASSIAPFALKAFQWAVAEGVIFGTSKTTLEPLSTTTRAQVSAMVYRLLAKQD